MGAIARLLCKVAGKPFLEQDRPKKVKEIYRALVRDHPDYPAELKARIAARKGKSNPKSRKSPEHGGPKYKAPLSVKKADSDEQSKLWLPLAILLGGGSTLSGAALGYLTSPKDRAEEGLARGAFMGLGRGLGALAGSYGAYKLTENMSGSPGVFPVAIGVGGGVGGGGLGALLARLLLGPPSWKVEKEKMEKRILEDPSSVKGDVRLVYDPESRRSRLVVV